MGKNNKRKTTEEYIKEVKNLVGDKISVIGSYHNCKTHVKMHCNECDNDFEMSPDHFLRGYRCPKCSYKNLGISKRNKNDDVKSILLEKGYSLLSEYKTSNEKILVQKNDCGHKFSTKFRYIKSGQIICPGCRMSKGELKIKKWLEENNFNFQEQFKYKDCFKERALPFDFKVNYNNKDFLIEFNGKQHYDKNYRNGKGSETLEVRIERDNIKKEYCINNNINLLVIKYDAIKDIKNILDLYFSSSTTNRKVYTQVSGNGDALKWD